MRRRPPRLALWFATLGGGLAWVVHFALAYLVAEWSCLGASPSPRWLGVTTPAWVILGASLVLAAVALAAALVARRLACISHHPTGCALHHSNSPLRIGSLKAELLSCPHDRVHDASGASSANDPPEPGRFSMELCRACDRCRLGGAARASDDCGRAEAALARGGYFLNAVFTFVIVAESLPISYYLRSC